VDSKPASVLTAIRFNKQLCICSNNERWISNRRPVSEPSDLVNGCIFVAIMRGGYQPGVRSHGRQITKHLEVPNELIGTIIGRHGMKISEIRQVNKYISHYSCSILPLEMYTSV